MNEIKETYQMTPKPQINPYDYEELERQYTILKQALIDNDKKWQSDYDSLLVKYELLREKINETN